MKYFFCSTLDSLSKLLSYKVCAKVKLSLLTHQAVPVSSNFKSSPLLPSLPALPQLKCPPSRQEGRWRCCCRAAQTFLTLTHKHTHFTQVCSDSQEEDEVFLSRHPHLLPLFLSSSPLCVQGLLLSPLSGAADGPRCARRPGAAPRPGEVLKVLRDKAFGLRLGLCTFVMEN